MIEFDIPLPLVIGLLISTVLPLLVGLVTTRVTSSGAKAALLAGLAAINGLAVEFAASLNAGEPYNIGTGLLIALGSFLVAVGLHFGIYKPTGASAAVQETGVK
jgi:hypothetical protein